MSDIGELLGGLDMSQVDAQAFATIVTNASGPEMRTVFGEPALRVRVLDEIFRRMGDHLRADRATQVSAVVHWRLTGGAGDDGSVRPAARLTGGGVTCGLPFGRGRRSRFPVG